MASATSPPRVLVDSWYAERLGVGDALEAQLRAELPAVLIRAAERSPILRAFLFAWVGRNYDAVVTIRGQPGTLTLLALEALLRRGQRRVVLLEVISRQTPERPSRRLVWTLWSRLVVGPLMRNGMRRGQVLTAWEADEIAERYRLPRDRLVHVPWPWRRDDTPLEPLGPGRRVLATGRAYCDWPTLFAASERRDWALTVVCSWADEAEVRALAAGQSVEVRVEIPRADHDRLMSEASVYVLALREGAASSGQVRLMDAVRFGAPVVTTAIAGLDGYVVPDVTAIEVPPGDALALRRAVERLLKDPAQRERLRESAWSRAGQWRQAEYLVALRELISGPPRESDAAPRA